MPKKRSPAVGDLLHLKIKTMTPSQQAQFEKALRVEIPAAIDRAAAAARDTDQQGDKSEGEK